MFELVYAIYWGNCPATKCQVCHIESYCECDSNSCKWLAEHFSTEICKNANYSVQIIEKWQDNGGASRSAINLGEAIVRRKRETE